MSQLNYRLLHEIAEIFRGEEIENYLSIQERDLIFQRDRDEYKIYLVKEDRSPSSVVEPYLLIRSGLSNYLDIYFNSELGKNMIQNHFSHPHSAGDLITIKNIKIPMLNEEVLNQLQNKTLEQFTDEDFNQMKQTVTKATIQVIPFLSAATGVAYAGAALGAGGTGMLAAMGPVGALAGAVIGGISFFKKKQKLKEAVVVKEKSIEHDNYPVRETHEVTVKNQEASVDLFFEKFGNEMQEFLETGKLEQAPTEEQYRLQNLYMLREIYNLTKRVDEKVDLVLQSLQQLQIDLNEIRESDRNMEEKIQLISIRVDQRLENMNENIKEDVQTYRKFLQSMISHWDHLDPLSQEFLPLAEYLYDKLGKIENADFSPVILQYCRSLENELLQKLFVSFSLHLYEKEKNLKAFLADDFENPTVKKFARPIYENRNKSKASILFTLGAMRLILVLAKRDDEVEKSPLLKEFRHFIQHTFKEQFILTDDYMKQLQKIVDDYRNKCAHPYKLGRDMASQCREIVPNSLNKLLQGFDSY
jgi:hypothetical protein